MARLEDDGRIACRLIALANALGGMSRAGAAEQAGMDRQTLRDWVLRFNQAGVEGLRDRPRRTALWWKEWQASIRYGRRTRAERHSSYQ